jgi:hypothetical protein
MIRQIDTDYHAFKTALIRFRNGRQESPFLSPPSAFPAIPNLGHLEVAQAPIRQNGTYLTSSQEPPSELSYTKLSSFLPNKVPVAEWLRGLLLTS